MPEALSTKSSTKIAQTKKEPIKDEVTLSMLLQLHKQIASPIHTRTPLDLHDTHQAQKHLDLVEQPKIELWVAPSSLLSALTSESEAKISVGCAQV